MRCFRLARATLALLLLAACAAPTASGGPVLEVDAAGAGNSADIVVQGTDALIEVRSERGLGALTLRHVAGPPPARIELRLALAGLEQLELRHDGGQIVASVASGPGHAVTQSMRAPDGSERPLAPDDPAWLPIAVVAAQPDPPFPLAAGQFVVELPGALIDAPSRTIAVRWLDFFR